MGAAGLTRCPPSLHQRLPGQAVRCSLQGGQWGVWRETGKESCTLHSTHLLTLWVGVESSAAVVKVSGPRVCLSLTKARPGVSWQKLVRKKFGWIRRDTSAAEVGEESTDSQGVGPGRGFLNLIPVHCAPLGPLRPL